MIRGRTELLYQFLLLHGLPWTAYIVNSDMSVANVMGDILVNALP